MMTGIMHANLSHTDASLIELAGNIKKWAEALGFTGVAITDTNLQASEAGLTSWLEQGFHGEMDYMAKHGLKRARPTELVPGTQRIISVRMPYLHQSIDQARQQLAQEDGAYISRYALGRDYHKVLRQRLQLLADRIQASEPAVEYRAFVDSAPVLEVALAAKAGLGWRGKHTLLLNRKEGSFYFLGELFTNLPLPIDTPEENGHCGTCTACIQACPTGAIVAPYQVDARRCISYLTIELHGPIPEPLRPLIGNRIYGCDDCQLFCPWNRFATLSQEADFAIRHQLDTASLIALFNWDHETFQNRMAGSPIYRIGHERWQRNLAVALGNAPYSTAILETLQHSLTSATPLVAEHIEWAIRQQQAKAA